MLALAAIGTVISNADYRLHAAVITEFKEGGAVISAMFTGRKVHKREPVDAERS